MERPASQPSCSALCQQSDWTTQRQCVSGVLMAIKQKILVSQKNIHASRDHICHLTGNYKLQSLINDAFFSNENSVNTNSTTQIKLKNVFLVIIHKHTIGIEDCEAVRDLPGPCSITKTI